MLTKKQTDHQPDLSTAKFSNQRPPVLLPNLTELPAFKNGLLSERYLNFDLKLRALINPEGRKTTFLQGAAGAGAARILLATDATTIYFVDHLGISLKALEQALKSKNWHSKNKDVKLYKEQKFKYGFALAERNDRAVAHSLLCELFCIGVEHNPGQGDQIVVVKDSNTGAVEIKFKWGYPGKSARERKIIYINSDIAESDQHIKIISQNHPRGIDGYYQQASYELLNIGYWYLPSILDLLKPGADLLVDTRMNDGSSRAFSLRKVRNATERSIIDSLTGADYEELRRITRKDLAYYGQAVHPFKVI